MLFQILVLSLHYRNETEKQYKKMDKDIKELNLKDRIIFAIKPILMYCIFVSEKQIVSVLNTKISFLLPTITEIDKDNMLLSLNFDTFVIEIILKVENKENKYIKIIGFE